MRNLSLASTSTSSLPDVKANVTATAIDLDENTLYIASERRNADADVVVEIWRSKNWVQDTCDSVSPVLFTTFTTNSHHVHASQVASLHVLPETRNLAVIMRGGDITMISLDNEEPTIEVEGTVEPGILGASWSPDDSLLVLVTGEDKLILMTSTFDVLSETPLHTSDFGEDAPINVGWGSKHTQFHGSLGKSAASAAPLSTAAIGSSPDDDTLPRISWRGDGAFFVTSTLTPAKPNALPHRTLRVYDRQAALQSTSEPVAGLEHTLAWRWSGNIIVGTQRFGTGSGMGVGREGRHDVVFFERNGLRHGEFGLRVDGKKQGQGGEQTSGGWGYKVRELSWSSDSNVLAVWIERDEGDVVQLWTTGNYHWYLKQEIHAPSTSTGPGRFTSVGWHPEDALSVILTTSSDVIHRTYSWDTYISSTEPPNDSGTVAVFDGATILLTPFRTQNVPPPMSSHQLSLSSSPFAPTPVYASFAPLEDTLAILYESGKVELWALHTRLGPGKGKVMDPIQTWAGVVSEDHGYSYRQVIICGSQLVVLGSGKTGNDVLRVGKGKDDTKSIEMPGRNGRMLASDYRGNRETIVWQAADGALFEVNITTGPATALAHFPEFCFSAARISMASGGAEDEELYVGQTSSGKLYLAGLDDDFEDPKLISGNANSFTIASGFLIFTTTAHDATFIPLSSLQTVSICDGGIWEISKNLWAKRRVERGSRIVVAVPSTMSLVLQMPRGNLETINPRPLVMEVVKQDLDVGNYRKAFFACRKHRIDLNVLVDHNEVAFLDGLSSFVDQIPEVDHINLFLTGLGRGSQTPETIAKLCDAIRVELEKKDLTKYINSILTAYVVKTPPDHEAGLALLLRLRDTDPHLVEDAVKYIIFLVDADRLFDTALGMYDFSLVLMIAQHAQKDPREYLPFLRELRALDKHYQRYRIDDHLNRHEKALENLSLAGSDYFDEAVAYVERHQLYQCALSIWKGTDRYNSILVVYGDWLFERRDFSQAALVFIEAEAYPKAMVAHEKALEWQELFDLAVRENLANDDVVSMAYRIAEDLCSKKRYPEAAQALLDYAKDVREAVIALVQGNRFSEARRVATLHTAPELLEDVIYPGALESRSQLADDINEMREQLRKQTQRLRELRLRKIQEPDAFYGVEDSNLHNVDVMTDVSMPATAFTRYTVAPTSASRSSKRTSRSKRKMERKVGSGKKGTVDEEEYLLKSVTKLVGRFNTTQEDARNLLPHLSQFSDEHREEGVSVQQDLDEFEQELKASLEEIWKKATEDEEDEDTWAKRMEELEKKKLISATDKVVKPELSRVDWRMKMFQMQQTSP